MSAARRTRDGFTLIELLIVMAIIGLLAALLMPVMGVMKRNATITRTEAVLQIVHAGIDEYRELYRAYPPTEAAPLSGNRLGFYLCASAADATLASRRSSVLTDRIGANQIVGDAIVDPFDRTPLIYVATTPAGAARTAVPMPSDLGSDATDFTATAYEGYESTFELWSAGPDKSADAIRNAPVNEDNISVTTPFGDMHAR